MSVSTLIEAVEGFIILYLLCRSLRGTFSSKQARCTKSMGVPVKVRN